METNNFLSLPTGLMDPSNRVLHCEDSGYNSYSSLMDCLYHYFDVMRWLNSRFLSVNAQMVRGLFIYRPFTSAWDERNRVYNIINQVFGDRVFEISPPLIADIAMQLCSFAPPQYRLTHWEIEQEWFIYMEEINGR